MPLGIPPDFLFILFIFGTLSGYLAYFLTSHIEKIDAPNMRPFGLMAYLALILIAGMSDSEIRSSVCIVSGVFIALLVVGVAMRGNSTSVLDRLVFFGCALLMSPFLCVLGYYLILFIYSVAGPGVSWWDDEDYSASCALYMAIIVVSIFASPFMENLYRFAMSMRSKPN